MIFWLEKVQKWYVLSGNCVLEFEYSSFPGSMLCSLLLSHDAAQWQQAAASSQHVVTRVNHQYTYHRAVFHFQYSLQYVTWDS